MTTATESVKASKAAKKPARSIRVLVPAADGSPAIVRITVERKSALYAVREVESELGGRGFLVREIGVEGTSETYQCHASGVERHCTCQGYLRHGRCKHHDGLAHLIEQGLL